LAGRRAFIFYGNTAQFCVLDHRAGRADPLREKRSCYFVYQRAFSQRGRRAMVGETARKASAVNCAGLP
jgi:hypothetical protein